MIRKQLRQLWQDLESDGWELTPLYGGVLPSDEFGNPSPDGDWQCKKDGFTIHLYNAKDRGERALSVAGWGPDGLTIAVCVPYSMDFLRHELQFCHTCGAYPVETVRYGFAGRCCKVCRPDMAAKYEKPGWTK
jgi:hypothetical protein